MSLRSSLTKDDEQCLNSAHIQFLRHGCISIDTQQLYKKIETRIQKYREMLSTGILISEAIQKLNTNPSTSIRYEDLYRQYVSDKEYFIVLDNQSLDVDVSKLYLYDREVGKVYPAN